MQAQSLMLPLAAGDAVWVRMFQRDQDNAIYSEHGDLYAPSVATWSSRPPSCSRVRGPAAEPCSLCAGGVEGQQSFSADCVQGLVECPLCAGID